MCIVGVKNVINEERTFMTKNEERMMTKKEAANPALLPVSLLSLLMQQSRLSSKMKLSQTCQTFHAPQFFKALTMLLNYRKRYARWVPFMLGDNHKSEPMTAALSFLE